MKLTHKTSVEIADGVLEALHADTEMRVLLKPEARSLYLSINSNVLPKLHFRGSI